MKRNRQPLRNGLLIFFLFWALEEAPRDKSRDPLRRKVTESNGRLRQLRNGQPLRNRYPLRNRQNTPLV